MEMENNCVAIPVHGDVCIRRQRRKRQKKLLVELFLDFSKNTTLHGPKYMTETGLNVVEKIFWIVTFVSSLIVCSVLIYNVWYKWQTSPVIVSFSAKHVPVEEVPFPAVTICPETKFTEKMFNYTNIRLLYDKYGITWANDVNNTDAVRTADILSIICDDNAIKEQIPYLVASDVETIINSSFRTNNIIIRCEWQGQGCSGYFKKVLTKKGVCHYFNGLSAKELLTDKVHNDFIYTYSTDEIQNWTMKDGYLSKSHEYVYPYRGRINVDQPNLELLLNNWENYKDKRCNGYYTGYKIYLHHPAEYPQALLYGFDALPKQSTSVGVKFTMETANSDLRKYPIEIRQCYFPEDRPLKYFRYYTYNNCMLECLTEYVYKECGCVSFYMPYHNSSTICTGSFKHKFCLRNAATTFTNSEDSSGGDCRCLPACNNIQYDADIHKSIYFRGAALKARYGELISLYGGIDYDPESNSEMRVVIFYKQPVFKSVHRSVLFSLTDFISNCGGIMGLFLGFSWLSLVEIFYFLTFRVYRTIKKDIKNEKSAEKKVSVKF